MQLTRAKCRLWIFFLRKFYLFTRGVCACVCVRMEGCLPTDEAELVMNYKRINTFSHLNNQTPYIIGLDLKIFPINLPCSAILPRQQNVLPVSKRDAFPLPYFPSPRFKNYMLL